MTADISKPHKAYQEMAKDWELPEALVGGTPTMRSAGVTFLPQ